MNFEPNRDTLSSRLSKADRAIEHEKLSQRIRDLGGMVSPPAGDEVSDLELSFLRRVLAYEEGPTTTHRAWLARQGLKFKAPDQIPAARLTAELWRLIGGLVRARVFLENTDHLSDAELYAKLWTEVLEADEPEMARAGNAACHWDFADPTAGDPAPWLMYYADDDDREQWQEDYPDFVLPPRRECRYPRKHLLPKFK